MFTQRLKPPKAPRSLNAKKEVDPNAQPKVKKPRTKKETKVAKDTEQDVVAQLVEAANAPMTPVEGSPPAIEAPAAPVKKTRKPRVKKADVAAVAADLNEEMQQVAEAPEPAPAKAKAAPKEKKPRAKKVKAEPAPEPVPVAAATENDEDEDEEIQTTEITIGNKTFLIDNENNVYSIDTHDQVGIFNAELNEVIAC